MALAFRAATSGGDATNNSSGGAVVINKPTGTIDGDIIIVAAYLETDTNTWASPGSGFTSIQSGANTGAFLLQAWWKRASSEPASWTWTPTSTGWRSIVAASYSGATGSGNQIDVAGTVSQGDSIANGSQTAASITTTANGDMICMVYGNFGGADTTSATGAVSTIRVTLGGTAIADALQTTAGATGTGKLQGAGTQSYAAFLFSILADSGGAAAHSLPVFQRRWRRVTQRSIR